MDIRQSMAEREEFYLFYCIGYVTSMFGQLNIFNEKLHLQFSRSEL